LKERYIAFNRVTPWTGPGTTVETELRQCHLTLTAPAMAALVITVAVLIATVPAAAQGFDVERTNRGSGGTFTTDDISGNFVDPDSRADVGDTQKVRLSVN
jgi:hypothetical protein